MSEKALPVLTVGGLAPHVLVHMRGDLLVMCNGVGTTLEAGVPATLLACSVRDHVKEEHDGMDLYFKSGDTMYPVEVWLPGTVLAVNTSDYGEV